MLVPDNHISTSESILGFGAYVIKQLEKPKTPDRLWGQFVKDHSNKKYKSNQSFDSLILTLDFLFAIEAIKFDESTGEVSLCG